MLYGKVRSDMIAARMAKESERVIILSTFLGELSANAKIVNGVKTVTDDEVVQLAKKFIKGLDELISGNYENTKAIFEKAILSEYIPAQMSEEQLTDIIKELISNGANNMGMVMKELKQTHDGKYDGRLASTITKGLLR